MPNTFEPDLNGGPQKSARETGSLGAKVEMNKYDDAVDKLQNISDTATALANAPKQKLEDATGINEAVVTATACVGSL